MTQQTFRFYLILASVWGALFGVVMAFIADLP